MNAAIIMAYTSKRMAELAVENNFRRVRHFVLAPGEIRQIDGGRDVYLLTEPAAMIAINSDFGFFDLSADNTNELQYEHSGKITITNYSAVANHVCMIQAIVENR